MEYKCHLCNTILVRHKRNRWQLQCDNGCVCGFGLIENDIEFYFGDNKGHYIYKLIHCKTKLYKYAKYDLLIECDLNITFEDGVPQVFKLIERMKKLMIYS